MMRKIIVSEFVSADGVMEDVGSWSIEYFADEMAKYKFEELKEADGLLLGRISYDDFIKVWPDLDESDEYTHMMNHKPKYVVSTTRTEVTEWKNSTLIKDDVIGEITKLKEQAGKDLLIFGSADLINSLMDHDLIDEYRLMVHPVVVNKGKKLFNGKKKHPLKLKETKTFSTGVVLLTYTK